MSYISSHVYWYWVLLQFIICVPIAGAPVFHHMYTGAGCSFISTQVYWYWCLLTKTHVVPAPHFITCEHQGVPSFHYRCSTTGTVLLRYIHHTCTETVCTCVLVLGEATFCHMSTDTGCSLVHHMCNIFLSLLPEVLNLIACVTITHLGMFLINIFMFQLMLMPERFCFYLQYNSIISLTSCFVNVCYGVVYIYTHICKHGLLESSPRVPFQAGKRTLRSGAGRLGTTIGRGAGEGFFLGGLI